MFEGHNWKFPGIVPGGAQGITGIAVVKPRPVALRVNLVTLGLTQV